jgi:leader peptidase (prepilin peptidase) / N-methyltransferase
MASASPLPRCGIVRIIGCTSCFNVIPEMDFPLAWQLSLIVAAPFVGSFLGVVVDRLPAGRPIVLGRSACRHCKATLAVPDLIPLFSWLMSRGKCRHCGRDIGLFHPMIELAATGIAIWSAAVLPGWIAAAGVAFGWVLLALAWIDQRTFLLPDVLVLPLIPAGLLVAWLIDPTLLRDHVIGAAAGLLLFAAVAWIYRNLRRRNGLGGGDVKLLGALGAWVAWQGLPTVILYAALSGLLWELALAARGKRMHLGRRIPFGLHLCIGGWLVWLYGPLVGN